MGIEGVRLSFDRIVEFSLQITHRCNVEDEKQEIHWKSFDKDICIDRNETTLTSRRRNYKGTNESQAGWEEKDMVSWTSPVSIPVQMASSIQETREEIETYSSANASVPESMMQVHKKNCRVMRSEPSMSDLLLVEGSNSQTHKFSGDYESASESSEEVEEAEDEEARENGDKAVKWTEDDEKNLMDLGLSEIERNKRLESLIAKRRGRKLIHGLVPVEEDPMNIDRIPSCPISKVSAPKHSPFHVPNSAEEMEGLPIPCSAPSVLLPMRNPFDLPYDPLEEKPNLMADSFHREYTAADRKELSYCRHESFCFGPSFPPESKHNLQEPRSSPFFATEKWAYDGLGYSRFGKPFDSEKEDREWLIEPLLFKAGKEMTNAQINDGELHPRDNTRSSDTTSSSSSENLEENFNGDRARQSLTCSTQSSRTVNDPPYNLSPSASNRQNIDDCFSFAQNAPCHTPTYSIASDLQVEVSEISSPPMTFDGTNSAADGESLTYDGDIEKEMSLGGDEIWESSDFYGGVENEMDLREANKENAVDTVNFWETDKRFEDFESQWNPFAAVRDSVDHPEKSSTASNDIINGEMEEDEDEDEDGGQNKSFNSVSEKPSEYQDYGSSERSSESDEILNPMEENEKAVPKHSEDEESRVESEDSDLQQRFGESIVSGEKLMLDVEEVAPTPESIQQDHPISSSTLNRAIEAEMEYNVQSSSSGEEASPSPRTENHLVEGTPAHPSTDSDSKRLQCEAHSPGNSQEEVMDKAEEDVDTKVDEEKPSLKSGTEFERESEKLRGYEADLDPTTPTVRRKTSFPTNTLAEAEVVEEKLTPGTGMGNCSGAVNEDEASSSSSSSRSLKPKEDEEDSTTQE